MSFGFANRMKEIDEAITHAYSKNTIMFAAASNSGGNAVPSWPARLPTVICVHANDGLGNKAEFNTSPRQHMDNFSILGEDVKSCWPSSLMSEDAEVFEMRRRGISCATPIAAGIAAIMLEFAGRQLSKRTAELSNTDLYNFTKLRSGAGMRSILSRMATVVDGYQSICPWNFLAETQGGYDAETCMALIKRDLRFLA
jgi:hypothetical protein